MNKILQGDCLEILKTLPDESVDCVVTSPPYYGLRDYGVEGQIGLEPTLNEYLDKMLLITAELKRVLKKRGTCWWNHGDSYGGSGKGGGNKNYSAKGGNKAYGKTLNNKFDGPEKSLLLQAHRLAIRMIDEQGWILRNQIIWHKPNVMPSSVKDRFTVDFEPIFFFSKSKKYYFEQQYEPAQYDGRKDTKYKGGPKDMAGGAHERWQKDESGNHIKNKRSVWKIATKPFKEAHFATFPETLIEIHIKAGCPPGGVCLDPFMGAGTTAVVAKKLGRQYLGIELNKEYIEIAERRIAGTPTPLFCG